MDAHFPIRYPSAQSSGAITTLEHSKDHPIMGYKTIGIDLAMVALLDQWCG